MRFSPPKSDDLPAYVRWPITAIVAVLAFPLWGTLLALVWMEKAKLRIFGPTTEWAKWFAWRPVTTSCWSDGGSRIVWMETVERRLPRYGHDCEYRLPGDLTV